MNRGTRVLTRSRLADYNRENARWKGGRGCGALSSNVVLLLGLTVVRVGTSRFLPVGIDHAVRSTLRESADKMYVFLTDLIARGALSCCVSIPH